MEVFRDVLKMDHIGPSIVPNALLIWINLDFHYSLMNYAFHHFIDKKTDAQKS